MRPDAALCCTLVDIKGTLAHKSSSFWLWRSKVVKENSLLFVFLDSPFFHWLNTTSQVATLKPWSVCQSSIIQQLSHNLNSSVHWSRGIKTVVLESGEWSWVAHYKKCPKKKYLRKLLNFIWNKINSPASWMRVWLVIWFVLLFLPDVGFLSQLTFFS